MKTLCLTSAAWFAYRPRCLALMETVLNTLPESPDSVALDVMAVLRTGENATPSGTFKYEAIDLRSWINEGHREQGVLNIEAVRRSAIAAAPNGHVLIDATGYTSETIDRALTEFHAGLYALTEWPASVSVVCDEAQIYQVLPRLTTAFYIRPDILGRTAIDTMLRRKKQEALMLLLYGRGIGAAPTFIKAFVSAVQRRREAKIAKQYGWVWEE